MVTIPPKKRPPEHGGLDFDDGRTSGLERTLVWVAVICSIVGAIGALAEVYQGLHTAGVW